MEQKYFMNPYSGTVKTIEEWKWRADEVGIPFHPEYLLEVDSRESKYLTESFK